MSALPRRTQLWVGTLLALWAVSLLAHVYEVIRSGLAMPPIYAVAGPGPDAYPLVGGFPQERGRPTTDIRPGDRLIQVGEADLRGVGTVGFEALAAREAGDALRAPLLLERDGERRRVDLAFVPFAQPWFRVPFLLLAPVLAGLVALRRSITPELRLGLLGIMGIAISEAWVPAGGYWRVWISWVVFNLGIPVSLTLILLWAIRFPEDVPPEHRLARGWALVPGGVSLLQRLTHLFGSPLPADWISTATHATDALLVVSLAGIVTWNQLHAGDAARRRTRWVVYGFWVAAVPLGGALLVPLLAPGLADLDQLLPWVGMLGATAVLGFFVAIARDRLFGIDRLLSLTATTTLLGVGVLAAVLAVVPRLAAAASRRTGLDAQDAELVLALALGALVVPLFGLLRPSIERLLEHRQRSLEEGVERLLRDLSLCRDADQVTHLVGERLAVLLQATRAATFVRQGDQLVGTDPDTGGPLALDAGAPLLAAPTMRSTPLSLERLSSRALSDADLPVLATLRRLAASVLVPVRSGAELASLTLLGPRATGEPYDGADLALLGRAAEKASAQLLRLRNAEVIRREQERVEALRAKRDEAERANLDKSRFLAAASHDLRQSLHALGLFVDALYDRVQGGEAGEVVQRLHASTESLTEMFDGLLDISRLDAGRVRASVSDFALDPMLERLQAELAPQAEEKGLALRRVPTGVAVRSDPVLLGRIVQNLLVNAIRYTEEGRVLVGCRRCGDAVRIEVWDTGPGIAPERQAEIFQEFVQLESGDRRAGLGLGLSIVDRLARLLEHRLELRSTPGAGSRFSVLVARGEASPEPVAAPRSDGDLAGRSVLVVDDDPEIVAALRALLERWRCRVLAAGSAEEALAQVGGAAGPPEVVLSDYRLAGGETGLDVIRAVREAVGVELPAAVITGETQPEILEAIRGQGLQRLAKPVPAARLRAVLSHLLEEVSS